MTTHIQIIEANFETFLKIFKDTGNTFYAAHESGWDDISSENPTVSLRSIPQIEHSNYLHYTIHAPSSIQLYIDTAETLTQHEINNLEIGMEKYHCIDIEKFYISYDPDEKDFVLDSKL